MQQTSSDSISHGWHFTWIAFAHTFFSFCLNISKSVQEISASITHNSYRANYKYPERDLEFVSFG